MSTKHTGSEDSMAQRRQAKQNEQKRGGTGTPADKKLDGPNRPSV
ncbi:hypothetical protein [Paenibacillus sp. GYB003]